MTNLEKKAEAYRAALKIYHEACAYTNEMRERAEQARERQAHLRGESEKTYNELMKEVVGEEAFKHNILMFG